MQFNETGKKAIYVNRLISVKIEGLNEEQSEKVLQPVFQIGPHPAVADSSDLSLGRSGEVFWLTINNAARTYLSLGKDAPVRRIIQRAGRIEVRPILGGLHHQ